MSLVPEEMRDGKIGRFPVWAIGVLIAGAIILFLFIRNRNRNAVPENTDPDVPGEGAFESVDGLAGGDFIDQLGGNFPSNVSLAPIPERPFTNAQWKIAAFDFLVGTGKNPYTVTRALQKYLAGEVLTEDERALIDLATANPNISLPPEGANLPPVVTTPPPPTNTPPPVTTPPPTNTPPPASSERRYVIVAKFTTVNPPWNSYLQGIASRYGRSVAQLQAWNGIKNPNIIYTGQKIYVDP